MPGKENKYPHIKEVSDELVLLFEAWSIDQGNAPFTESEKVDLGDAIRRRFTWIMTGEGAVKRVEITDPEKTYADKVAKKIIEIFDKHFPNKTFIDLLSSLDIISANVIYSPTQPPMFKIDHEDHPANRIEMADDIEEPVTAAIEDYETAVSIIKRMATLL